MPFFAVILVLSLPHAPPLVCYLMFTLVMRANLDYFVYLDPPVSLANHRALSCIFVNIYHNICKHLSKPCLCCVFLCLFKCLDSCLFHYF